MVFNVDYRDKMTNLAQSASQQLLLNPIHAYIHPGSFIGSFTNNNVSTVMLHAHAMSLPEDDTATQMGNL